MSQYTGTPEAYLNVPKNNDIDKDALTCILHSADSIILMLQNNFEEKTAQVSNKKTVNALWAVEGLLDQAKILISGK